MLPMLNEKQMRLYLASEAIAFGRGGITLMSRISGVSWSVITTGVKEIKSGDTEIFSADVRLQVSADFWLSSIMDFQDFHMFLTYQMIQGFFNPRLRFCDSFSSCSFSSYWNFKRKAFISDIGKWAVCWRKWDTVYRQIRKWIR